MLLFEVSVLLDSRSALISGFVARASSSAPIIEENSFVGLGFSWFRVRAFEFRARAFQGSRVLSRVLRWVRRGLAVEDTCELRGNTGSSACRET